MIVRILGDAQYEIGTDAVDHLTKLDAPVEAALAAGDDPAFRHALAELIAAVRASGTPVDAATILPSDLVLPNEDTSLSEVRDLLASEEADA